MVFDHRIAPVVLRQYLQEELVKRGWKQKDLAEAAEMESSTISNIFNRKQSLMLPQLHAINQAFGLPNDTFYELFIGECCGDNGRLKPEKTSDFILNCIAVEKYEIIKQLVQILHEETNRSKMIDTTFRIAEHIFQSDQRNYSLPFYDIITQNGYSRSERLAISYYRRFLILRDLDTSGAGNEALCQLLEYLPLLPDEVRLDAYYRILTFYNVVENWPKLLLYAKELRSIALSEGQDDYVAESWLYESVALKGMKNYESALKATAAYSRYGDHYARLSKYNELYISIEMKQIEAIEELMDMLKGDQVLLVLPVALDSYISNNALTEAREYLETYKSYVDDLLSRKDPFHLKHKLRLTQALSQYYFRIGQYGAGFEYNALSLELALKLKNIQRAGMAVIAFQEHEMHVSAEQKNRFINILLNEVDSNEKNINHDVHGSFLVQYYRSIVAG
ncbi:helix-turn-helix transcriptional regulator [Paenibacillus dendritiformis]|uniref:Helix-turn-helix domain-containing protein n=1 Tax=Paenibacillus dendritiformis C454 TaxID=1131935 RepID=H3SLX6_9BACL|nr:helix-turn-helix transcriptional regulator [Paenibacillus dendritiformis]EHQ59925.1 Helix-turn-helix domain-containing protein [Paenibacillus dendritiformis C454]CAH8767507.1 helix-turn-helix domain-containing protein [Paenibacillus dendritiformis]